MFRKRSQWMPHTLALVLLSGAWLLVCCGNKGQKDRQEEAARSTAEGAAGESSGQEGGKKPSHKTHREPKSVKHMRAAPVGPEPSIPELGDDVLVIQIPAQTLKVGSLTGQPGREPAKEMDLVPMELGAFSMDRYPYPNQKGVAPRTGVTLDEARDLCEAEGKRLCTELEWEAACKGGVNSVYPYSQTWDADRYGKGLDALTSGYGVAGMGALEEWTDSEYELPENPVPRGQVVRGSEPEEGKYEKRCAERGYRLSESSTGNLGFRCCSGPRNEAVVKLEPLQKPFSEVKDMEPSKFKELVNAIGELSAVHGDPRMFGESDLDYVLLRRNIDPRKSYAGYIFTTTPVWWHPMRGEEILAFTGFTGEDSFVAALYHLGDGRFKHAASMVLLGNPDTSIKAPLPVILVAGVDRDVLNWGPCWNCSEGGALYIEDEDNTIQISHRW